MRFYDPVSKKLKDFKPHKSKVATIYVCGVTPYDTTHLGHAFTYASFDVLIRYLERKGYQVKYVQNVTDIDDDILRKAKETGEDWATLGNRWTTHYIEDMQALNIVPPDHYPRATDFIPEIISTVSQLLEAGVAYESEGSLFFHVKSWPKYGQLSGLNLTEMLPIANERGNNPDDPRKRDPLDFVLWQAQAPGEPAWDSPWGKGRPGWHIECSTMACSILGETIDIHGGGSDLIFPHHESEIAQAEPLSDNRCFSVFWIHTAMVHHEGEKMSKSLGNLVMARDLLKGWSADTLRLYMSSHHYRQIWSYDRVEIEQADRLVKKLLSAVTVEGGQETAVNPDTANAAFDEAMDNDLDTPSALKVVEGLADKILSSTTSGQMVTVAQETLRNMCGIFGLRLDYSKAETRITDGWSKHLKRFRQQSPLTSAKSA